MSCPRCKASLAVQKLSLMAPRGAIEALVSWLEAQAGTKGTRRLQPVVVTENGEFVELQMPRPPEVYRKSRHDPDGGAARST